MPKTRIKMGLSRASRNIFCALLASVGLCIVFSNYLYVQPSNKMSIENKANVIMANRPQIPIKNNLNELDIPKIPDFTEDSAKKPGTYELQEVVIKREVGSTREDINNATVSHKSDNTGDSVYSDILLFRNSTQFTTNKSIENTKKKRRILWYNPPSYVRLSPTFNPLTSCPQLNCEYTRNLSQIQSSDIVIFDAHTLPVNPPQKLPNHKWVFFAQEAPIHIRHRKLNVPEWRTKFDLTATYRRDSDIPTVYGKIRGKASGDVVQRDLDYYNEIYKKKKRAAVWIVSHCSTPSKREDIVHKLKRFFPVDIFGGCGKDICSRYEDEECLRKVVGEYMFYISFENALCPDYITEKFFRFYSYDVIQIVRADVNFTEIAPAQTYIDYSDFRSVKNLAKKLKAVADNRETYISYLKRKDKFESIYEIYSYKTKRYLYSHSHYFNEPLCDLCRIQLSSSSNVSKYPDIYKWFYVNQCKTPTDVK